MKDESDDYNIYSHEEEEKEEVESEPEPAPVVSRKRASKVVMINTRTTRATAARKQSTVQSTTKQFSRPLRSCLK